MFWRHFLCDRVRRRAGNRCRVRVGVGGRQDGALCIRVIETCQNEDYAASDEGPE